MSCIGYHNSIHSLYSVSLLQYVEIIVKVYLAENVLLFSDLNQYELFICQSPSEPPLQMLLIDLHTRSRFRA